jgi:mitochondrial ATPase complex subunit ATP10
VTEPTEDGESSERSVIPPLQRPLGVMDVPTIKTKTLSERTADFLNQEKQLEKRRHLCVVIST